MTSDKGFKNGNSGSPPPGEPEYLVVGTLGRPHGLRGEMTMHVATDFPERLQPEVRVYLGKRYNPAIIESCRPHGGGMLIRFRGIETMEAAGMHRNQTVYVATADLPALPAGHYYHHQLIGCAVVNEKNESVGILQEILQTGANDVYVVLDPAGSEILLPVISTVVLLVDPKRRIICVRIPEGLLRGAAE